jgi:hypothetical protein
MVNLSNRPVQGMPTNRTLDENYELVFNDGVDDVQVNFHLMMPNVQVTPDGPGKSPVPTGFELPNGQEQPSFTSRTRTSRLAPGWLRQPPSRRRRRKPRRRRLVQQPRRVFSASPHQPSIQPGGVSGGHKLEQVAQESSPSIFALKSAL